MDQTAHSVKNDDLERSLETSSQPEVKPPASEQAESEETDKTIANQLLSSTPYKDGFSDGDNTQNVINESSGSDHLSVRVCLFLLHADELLT